MNSLALKDVDNEVLNEADEYLRKHKILELFEVNISIELIRAYLSYENSTLHILMLTILFRI